MTQGGAGRHLDEGMCPKGDTLLHIRQRAHEGGPQWRYRLASSAQLLLEHLSEATARVTWAVPQFPPSLLWHCSGNGMPAGKIVHQSSRTHRHYIAWRACILESLMNRRSDH